MDLSSDVCSSDRTMGVLGLVSAIAVTGLLAGPAAAQGLSLKFGHVGEPGSLFEASANEFARCANADLGDKAEVQVFGSSQLRSEERRVGKECVRTCRSRWSQTH